MPNLPETIGRYTILEKLATGGMAIVYLGFETGDTGLQRLVVIKQILPQYGENDTFRRMFTQEARLAANINHPNVVEIHELGEWEEQPFLAMEYVSGVALNVLVRKITDQGIKVPVGVAVGIIAQACAGAHAAHELTDRSGKPANLVHRDLTPHNLMVTETGHIKILDFGVAKASSNQDKTETGMLKGKLPYMSPEQLWQSEIDRRSDVFTLGVVLWELLSGSRLFAREAEVATINAVLNSTLPNLNTSRSDVPDTLATVALSALEKDLNKRTPSAEQFRVALLECGRKEQLDCSEDAIKRFVSDVLGASLAARKHAVAAQVEKSLSGTPESLVTKKVVASPSHQSGGASGTKRGLVVGVIATIAMGAALLFGLDLLRAPAGNGIEAGRGPAVDEGITIMLAPTVGPDILRNDLEPLRRYLQRKLGETLDWRFASSYQDAADALLNGDVQFASLPPTLYVQTMARNPNIELMAVKVHSGTNGSTGVLLVRESGPIKTEADIEGSTICYTDPKSTTGYILPRAALRKIGVDPDKDLAEPPVISGNHISLIQDIINGRCDIGGTFMAAYVNAQEADINTALARVLTLTGRTPHDAISAGPQVKADLKTRMREALLDFDPNKEAGQQFLGSMERLTGFAPVDDRVYDSVRQALDNERSALLTE